MIIGQNPSFVYLIAGGIALLIGLIVSMGIFALQKNNEKTAYDDQLEELIKGESDDGPQITLSYRWNQYWGERFKAIGWSKYSDDNSTAGRDIGIFAIVLAVIVGVLLRNPLAGIGISLGVTYLSGVFMKSKSNKDADVMNAQLPGFLFALKANVQANETPERAILKIVDSMPSPLYDELAIVKQRLLANSSFKDALEELAETTSSRDLRFLCSCMIQAANSGANLEGQITVIQNVLEARRKVSDELAKAARSAAPAIWVASVVIPGTFIGMYFMDPNARGFWFNDILSWAALAGVIFLYIIGVWMSKKLVDNIKNL